LPVGRWSSVSQASEDCDDIRSRHDFPNDRTVAAPGCGRAGPRLGDLAIVAAMLPIYSWDCMDGYSVTWCGIPGIVRAIVTDGRQCGDLGW
jgi:hypothetical protein